MPHVDFQQHKVRDNGVGSNLLQMFILIAEVA